MHAVCQRMDGNLGNIKDRTFTQTRYGAKSFLRAEVLSHEGFRIVVPAPVATWQCRFF